MRKQSQYEEVVKATKGEHQVGLGTLPREPLPHTLKQAALHTSLVYQKAKGQHHLRSLKAF